MCVNCFIYSFFLEKMSMSSSCIYLKIKRFSKDVRKEHHCSIFKLFFETKILSTFEILKFLETT